MSTLAVLLIIGSAVVGPIEAQPITDQVKMAVYDACIKRLGPSGDVAENNCRSYRCSDEAEKPVHYESLPELCERAMREVGAAKWYRYSKNSKYPNGLITYELAKDLPAGTPPPEVKWTLPQTAYEKIEQTAMAKYFQTQPGFSPEFSFGTTYWNGPEVRCIPVPTGYKR